MTKRVSAREARDRFGEIIEGIRQTGEPIIVEKHGKPFVALVRIEDPEVLEALDRDRAIHTID